MDHLHRVTWGGWLLALVALVVSLVGMRVAHAAVPEGRFWKQGTSFGACPSDGSFVCSYAEALNAYVQSRCLNDPRHTQCQISGAPVLNGGTPSNPSSMLFYSVAVKSWFAPNNAWYDPGLVLGAIQAGPVAPDAPPVCPSGSSVDPASGLCVPIVCPSGQVWLGSQCGVPNCQVAPWGQPGDVWNPLTSRCTPSCTKTMAETSITLGSGAGGQSFCQWSSGWSYCTMVVSSIGFKVAGGYRYAVTPTGEFCAGITSPDPGEPVPTEDPNPDAPDRMPDEPAEDKLPDPQADCLRRGMTYGVINGVGVCLPRGTPGGAATGGTDSASVTRPDGSTSTTTWTTETNADGTITVSVDVDGQVTTTTGTRDAICVDHPTLSVCRTPSGSSGEGDEDADESSWGGTCATGWTCEGDAIQCAIAREQHERNCELFAETDQAALFGQAIAGNDPGLDAIDPANRETVDLSASIDMTRTIGAGCVADRPFQVMGTTYSIPFSKLCPYLDMMGLIVVAMSLIAAARIVFV